MRMTTRRIIGGGAIGAGILTMAYVAGVLTDGPRKFPSIPGSQRAAADVNDNCACPCVEPEQNYTLFDWVTLMSGPGRCSPVWNDLDRDGDCDLRDFALLQNGVGQ